MATVATIGLWKFAHATVGAPTTYVDLEEVTDVSGVGVSAEEVDVTNFDSPAGTKEFIAGLKEGQEVSVECNYIPAATEQDSLMDQVDAGVNISFQATYNATQTFTFTGSPKGYTITPSTTDANKISFTIKISGDITRA